MLLPLVYIKEVVLLHFNLLGHLDLLEVAPRHVNYQLVFRIPDLDVALDYDGRAPEGLIVVTGPDHFESRFDVVRCPFHSSVPFNTVETAVIFYYHVCCLSEV